MDRFTRLMLVIGLLSSWGIIQQLIFRSMRKDNLPMVVATIMSSLMAILGTVGVVAAGAMGLFVIRWIMEGT